MRRHLRTIIGALVFGFVMMGLSAESQAAKPNIVLIMVDDMGFSDIGCYGSEIPTPNLDRLASGGLRFTQFYNTGRCCPTRAALMTGLYQHQAGMGHMTGNFGRPAYQGHLNDQCVTIAEALKPAGYYTAISGKWHVGSAPEHWPLKRGFDRFYGIPEGGGHHYRLLPGRHLVIDDTREQVQSLSIDNIMYCIRKIDVAVRIKNRLNLLKSSELTIIKFLIFQNCYIQ